MSARVAILVEQFRAANDAIIAFVEACDDTLWRAPTHDDGRQVNVVAHHVAEGGTIYPPLLASILGGGPLAGILAGADGDPDAAWAAVHAYNAAQDEANRECTRDEVLAALREHGDVVAAFIAALSDDDLDRLVTFPYSPIPIAGQELLIRLPIGHPRFHLVGLMATRAALRG